MKLQVPFVQLPLRFDAARLAEEISAFAEADWRPHPLGYAGNSALPLIAVDGNPDNDGFVGPMRPTNYLERCPYLTQVLDSLGAVWGRVRLMRLSGQSEVEPHVDINYYWHERVRVHVPILTQPSVRFHCGAAEINMAAGECWIFDTWRLHRVVNVANDQRIHLVADTIGSERFWQIANAGRAPGAKEIPGWSLRSVEPDVSASQSATLSTLLLESVNSPAVMTPWEVRQHVGFLMSEATQHPKLAAANATAMRFLGRWQALWARYGEAREGWPEYRTVLDAFAEEWRECAIDISLRNEVSLHRAMMSMVVRMALADRPVALADQAVESLQTSAELRFIRSGKGEDPTFYRPVFIVSPPRSGSTMLFEALAQAPNVYTIGDESHFLIESIPELHPAASGYASNRLDANAAQPAVMIALRAGFREALRDRAGQRSSAARLRMLEKTPKNSLRIPFLAHTFPEAHFVYLYRDVREVLASMIEAWVSERFRTYPKLPGWNGPAWSLALTPGWRELAGKSLHEIVAAQWLATTRLLLDDLEALPRKRWQVARYDALLADPHAEISRICAAVGFDWDASLEGGLPISRYTVSAPDAQKWRRHEREIEAVLPHLAATVARAERIAVQ